MKKNKYVLTLLYIFLQCLITRVSLAADTYFLFRAYEMQPASVNYQLRGYVVVRYASTDLSTHLQGDRFYVPVKNGEVVSKESMFRGKSFLARSTKASSAANLRDSNASNGKTTFSFGRDSLVNTDMSANRRRSQRRSRNNSGSQSDTPVTPSVCHTSFINFVVGEKPGSVHFEWIRNEEAAQNIKGRLTFTHNNGFSQSLENISHSGVHEFIVVHEQGVSDEDDWIMDNLPQGLTTQDLNTLAKLPDEDEQQLLSKFTAATTIPATRSSYEEVFPDPLWGTNCNWEHSALFILQTGQTGWELINHSGEQQHVLMMPETEITQEVAQQLEDLMGIMNLSEMGITISDAPDSEPPFPSSTESSSDEDEISSEPEPKIRMRAISVVTSIGVNRRWQALTDKTLAGRSFFLNQIKSDISRKMHLSSSKIEQLKSYLDGDITPEQIQELVELGIITRPEETYVPTDKDYQKRDDRDDKDDPGSAGRMTGGGSSGGNASSGTQNGPSSSHSGEKQDKGSSTTTNNGHQNSRQILTSDFTIPASLVFTLQMNQKINLTEKNALSALKKRTVYPQLHEPATTHTNSAF